MDIVERLRQGNARNWQCDGWQKEAADEIERLRKVVADMESEPGWREYRMENKQLREQLEAVTKDAERYRWLRDTNLDAGVRATGEHLEPLQVPMIFIGHPEDQWTLGSFASAWVGEKFDRAIDAAIDKARKTT